MISGPVPLSRDTVLEGGLIERDGTFLRGMAKALAAGMRLNSTSTPDGPPTIIYQPRARDRYALTTLHAQGGIGQVWRAQDGDIGREVALKELRPERADDQTIAARFLEEAKITGQLEHPGIVPVYELNRGGPERRPFYTMRFVRGRTLSQAVRAHHQKSKDRQVDVLGLRELLGAFVGVCNALAYAHSRGVIHRDLKGQNVVLGDFGEVMVLDWGLAKSMGQSACTRYQCGEPLTLPPVAVDKEASRDETIQGDVLGTPAYMSPEQAEGRQDQIDFKSDVYGLGAI